MPKPPPNAKDLPKWDVSLALMFPEDAEIAGAVDPRIDDADEVLKALSDDYCFLLATWIRNASGPFDHVWFWRCRLPQRKGQRCRVLVRGGKNTVAVQFEDSEIVFTSRYAVRRGAKK